MPHGHRKITTLTAAVRLDGVRASACLAFDGAIDSMAFEAHVERRLVPTPRPVDMVIMDDLACRKAAEVARLIAAAGAEVRYLPAYSPDLNPIERLFSELEAPMRSAAARTVGAPIEAMREAPAVRVSGGSPTAAIRPSRQPSRSTKNRSNPPNTGEGTRQRARNDGNAHP